LCNRKTNLTSCSRTVPAHPWRRFVSAQWKVLPRDSSTSRVLYRRLRLSIKHDRRDSALIDNRAMKQFAFCHSWFALCAMINYLQHWAYYMQHHITSPPPTPRAHRDVSADRINCRADRRSQCPTAITSTLPRTHHISARVLTLYLHSYTVHTCTHTFPVIHTRILYSLPSRHCALQYNGIHYFPNKGECKRGKLIVYWMGKPERKRPVGKS
jgi:hypothetical protein